MALILGLPRHCIFLLPGMLERFMFARPSASSLLFGADNLPPSPGHVAVCSGGLQKVKQSICIISAAMWQMTSEATSWFYVYHYHSVRAFSCKLAVQSLMMALSDVVPATSCPKPLSRSLTASATIALSSTRSRQRTDT